MQLSVRRDGLVRLRRTTLLALERLTLLAAVEGMLRWLKWRRWLMRRWMKRRWWLCGRWLRRPCQQRVLLFAKFEEVHWLVGRGCDRFGGREGERRRETRHVRLVRSLPHRHKPRNTERGRLQRLKLFNPGVINSRRRPTGSACNGEVYQHAIGNFSCMLACTQYCILTLCLSSLNTATPSPSPSRSCSWERKLPNTLRQSLLNPSRVPTNSPLAPA